MNGNRLTSLDVFRGITIAGMILVNNPGTWSNIYPALKHADWHGWTPTDFIFPFFLFIVGVSMVFSFNKRLMLGDSKSNLLKHVLRRSLIIFVLGMFLHLFPYFDFSTVRIPGVLQRIALVYLVASIMFLILNTRLQIILSIAILIFYWLAMKLIPVPNYGPGNLSPEGNLAAYIDRLIFYGHMWKQNWDPEGLLSTFPAVVTTMTGVFTGNLLISNKNDYEKTTVMFFSGFGLIILGIIWDMWFPINKYLWTSSYVLFMSGMALNFLAFCFYLIEIKNIKWWSKPFLVFGMNAITSFFLSSLVAKILVIIRIENELGESVTLKNYIFTKLLLPYFTPINASLVYAFTYMLIWFLIMLFFYKKRIFIKV